MNEQMTVWLITMGVFVAALILKIVERIIEMKVKDEHSLEVGDKAKNGYRNDEYDDSDEFGDL